MVRDLYKSVVHIYIVPVTELQYESTKTVMRRFRKNAYG